MALPPSRAKAGMSFFMTEADDANGIRADFKQHVVWKTSELGPAKGWRSEPECKAFGMSDDLPHRGGELGIKVASQTSTLVLISANRLIHLFLDADVEPQILHARSRLISNPAMNSS